MTTEDIAIIGAIATVVAAFGASLLGAFCAYKTGMKLVRKTNADNIKLAFIDRFNRASEKFILAFQEALTGLKYDRQKEVYEIITPELIRHKNAYIIFRRYLEGNDLIAFDVAWKHYFPLPKDGRNAPEYNEAEWDDKDERELVIKKIEDLIDFAQFNQNGSL